MKTDYNSKFDKNIEAFIQSRIEGKSFDEIATELKTTKSTLIDWNKKELVRCAIYEGKAFKINTIVKNYKFNLVSRLRTYLEISQRINDELLKRNLSDESKIPTNQLFKMSIDNDSRIYDLIKDMSVGIGHDENAIYLETGDNYFELEAAE
ncbi:MAG: hypothetical protein IPH96_15675 [Saprospiraceae bacterium]|nr:hypothetical protein [Saprospiraceae bacterium]MBK9994777.1 hypothetical protein [Saprospiraceae bacterium]